MDGALTLTAAPLLRLGEVLGLQADALAAVERADRLAGTFEVPSAAIGSVLATELDAFVREYGDAGRLEVRTGDLPDLTVAGGYNPDEFERLRMEAASKTTRYTVVIELDKEALASGLGQASDAATVRVFFFARVAEAHLGRGPRAIEQELWGDASKRLVLVVLDEDTFSLGVQLSILGGAYVDRVGDEITRSPSADLRRMATRRNDYVGWDSELMTCLTPAHFRREPSDKGAGLIRCVDNLVVGLGAMYLCDRARSVERPDGSRFVQAEFRGREHVAFVPIRWDVELPAVVSTHVDAVADVVDWCYELVPERRSADMIGDRLPFVQTRVAQLLEGRLESERLAAFALAMPAIGEGVRWHWRSFIEGRVTEYLDQVSQLETAVGETVAKLSEQTSNLVKRLSETSLAAVAALIGSFIAATFKDPFQVDLFRIGMLAYAGYVLAFPLAIGLTSAVGEARVTEKMFGAQRKNLATVLGDSRVDELIAGRTAAATDRFHFWTKLVALAFALAAVAAIVAAIVVPSAVASSSGPSTTATTTTVSPTTTTAVTTTTLGPTPPTT